MIYKFNFTKSPHIEAYDFHKESQYLKNIKNKIDKYPYEWKIIKKIIHDHEYVYTSPNKSKNISNYLPISRSYFKLTEIINKHNIIFKDKINCFAMAEAPGGFIESLLEQEENIDKIYATTLISDNKKVPYWNNKIKTNKKVSLLYGSKNNGDLIDIINILSFKKELKQSIFFVTADGGFDCTENYNDQEKNSLPLIYCEIFLALNVQCKGGIFVCKIFDISLKETIKLIYVLFLSYEKVYLHKPLTSRKSNSEKYIVCIGYKGYNKEIINNFIRSFSNFDLNMKIEENFLEQLKYFNKKYIEDQIKQINLGIQLIQTNKLHNKPTENQITKAYNWCLSNNIPINNNCYYLNGAVSR